MVYIKLSFAFEWLNKIFLYYINYIIICVVLYGIIWVIISAILSTLYTNKYNYILTIASTAITIQIYCIYRFYDYVSHHIIYICSLIIKRFYTGCPQITHKICVWNFVHNLTIIFIFFLYMDKGLTYFWRCGWWIFN